LGLVSLVLGSKLWFDAFFLTMIMFRPSGRHAATKPEPEARVQAGTDGITAPVPRGIGQESGIA
jgi:hypothetical protein